MTAGCDVRSLIEESQGLVRSIALQARKRVAQRVDLDDLIAYGQVGLAQAAREFDPARANRFSTYAYYRIRGAIYDGMAKMSWPCIASQVARNWNPILEEDADAGEDGKEGSAAWLANLTGELATAAIVTGAGLLAADQLRDARTAGPLAGLCTREMEEQIRQLIGKLPLESAAMMRSVYYEGKTLQEVADQLGISRSWACRLHSRTLRVLAVQLQDFSDVE